MDKNKDPFMYQLQFGQVKSFKSVPYVYIPLIFVSLMLYSFKLYQLIIGSTKSDLPFLTIFIVQIFIIALVLVVSVASLCTSSINHLWAYLILFCQSIGMIFVQTTMQCFSESKWCEGNVQYQAGAVLVLCLYGLIVWLRSCLYYPFYDNFNYLAMSSSSIVLFELLYKILFGTITNLVFISTLQSQRKFIILITLALYAVYNSRPYYCNPLIHNCWLIVYTFITWTGILIYLLPYFNVISTSIGRFVPETQNIFWYVWGYSTPCIILYVLIGNFTIDWKDGWKNLFLEEKHQIKKLDHLYLMISQLKQRLFIAKKSQQKTNDPLFKTIWALIQKHNQFCDHPECPLAQLKSMQVNRYDDFLELKRLSKAIQACYQFGLYHMERKKDKFPNLLQLSVQMANYQLEVFQNRQKGLLLYTQFYSKDDIDSSEKYTLYYLKKKIQQLFIDNQNYTKTNTQNQISQFRHNIQVSVSMLAQFWYFLADPKCNLKKLYDLANVLFPLKIGVDNQWKNIQKLKNIQSYHLYARYLIKMFNDKQKGMKIMDQAKKIQHQLKNKDQIEVDPQGNSNIGVQQNGIIFLEFDGKNPGVMYQINMAAEKIFGYSKGELANRKVNDIMPRIFANFHDKILQNYQQTNKTVMMNKERVVWGKRKDGYMFPFVIMIKPVKNLLSNSSQVYACVKRQTWVRQSAFLTLDMQEQISEISTAVLGIYPELYGKVNLKKKVHVTQIIPNFKEIKQKMLQSEGGYQYQVVREYQRSPGKKVKQTTTFNIKLEQIFIFIAGQIGYMIRFQKTLNINVPQKDLAVSHITENRAKQNNFRFIYQISQVQLQSGTAIQINESKVKLKYKGGIVQDIQQMAKSYVSSASKYFNKFPIQEEKKVQQRQRFDFSQSIKTKRLQGKQIREIHLVSEQSEYDIGEVEKEMEENQGTGNIKPSDLSLILEKQASNRNIFCLKVLTFIILSVSSLLYIIEYISIWSQHNLMISSNQKVRKLNQLGSQILYMKMYSTQFSSYIPQQYELQMLTNEINLLDNYLDYYPYNQIAKIAYNDGSSQNIMLGFALNKLMSEANSLRNFTTLLPQNNSHVFFVNYNTVNGLIATTNLENTLAFNAFNDSIKSLSAIQIIYLSIAFGLFFIAMFAKNFLLRIVVKKKSQILQVFFQIPRKACTSIQKQCQRFIQRLSSENQQDMEVLSMGEDGSDAGLAEDKKKHKQKKRTVMGEQKTTNNYIIATIAFLGILLFFHIFVMAYHESFKQNLVFSMQASQMIFRLQQQTALTINLMNSFALNAKIPFKGKQTSQSMNVIESEFNFFKQIFSQISVKFFLIGNILDSVYLTSYNQLLYQDLCQQKNKNATQCNYANGENYGLNVILAQYYNIINNKYTTLKSFYNGSSLTSSQAGTILLTSGLKQQRKIQYLLKEHWRSLTMVVRDGLNRLITSNDTIIFALMLTMCIANFTLLLFCWLKFYHSLEQKIAATQYILTFIPIDEINRNPKIANYIKQQILQKR